MFSKKQIIQSIVIFFVSYLTLIILFSFQGPRIAHAKYFAAVGPIMINVINPNIFTEFEEGAIDSPNNWDFTFRVWEKSRYDERIRNKRFRSRQPPQAIIYQNHYELFLLPTLFLISLFLATPVSFAKRFLKLVLGLLVFYVFSALYLSYRFELTLNRNELPYDSIWHFIIGFFGLGGNTDPIYVVCVFIWIALFFKQFSKSALKYF